MLQRLRVCSRQTASRAFSQQAGAAANIEPTAPVRVRFAPSPTGMLHLGGLRTALFNYLLARRYGGEFILRIEDTDQARLVPGAAEGIVQTLEWAGLNFDEGPGKGPDKYFQSQRSDIYRKHAQELLDRGAAYRCFCSTSRLEALRTEQTAQGRAPAYDRHCAHLSSRQIDEKLRAGERHTVRMRAPSAEDSDSGRFYDIVHRAMDFRGPAGFDDAVLLKSDGQPTYHLANVVDDHLMRITHVLRGEEWLMSTPKHRALFTAFGWPAPQYAHLPLLMNPDGSKLSKRNDDGPVQRYIADGYLPESLVNYTALLGWHPDTPQELFTLRQLEQSFSLAGLSRSKSVVSRERLDWLNRQHLRAALADPDKSAGLIQQARAEVAAASGLETASVRPETVATALHLAGDRLTFTKDLYNAVPFMFGDPALDTTAAEQALILVPHELHISILNALEHALASEVSESWIGFAKSVAAAAQVPTKHVMMMLRFALTGERFGPKIPELLDALPVDSIKRRIQRAKTEIESR
ncbi:Glutamate--tRNA ligase mitochondrial [Coemansia sp. RSA 678]|nr:Glutamate--tRNA ligase mitochondrial [Coemansia sp. RSA 678]